MALWVVYLLNTLSESKDSRGNYLADRLPFTGVISRQRHGGTVNLWRWIDWAAKDFPLESKDSRGNYLADRLPYWGDSHANAISGTVNLWRWRG